MPAEQDSLPRAHAPREDPRAAQEVCTWISWAPYRPLKGLGTCSHSRMGDLLWRAGDHHLRQGRPIHILPLATNLQHVANFTPADNSLSPQEQWYGGETTYLVFYHFLITPITRGHGGH